MEMVIQIFWDRGAPKGLELPVMRAISRIIDIPVNLETNPILFNGFVQSRNQFNAHSILDCIEKYRRRNNIQGMILLVISQDIFRDQGSPVFGLSRQAIGAGVVSSARLSNEFWNRPVDDNSLVERLAKEGSHEIGHLFSLEHCGNAECIMANPETYDDLNRKKMWLCDLCRTKINKEFKQGF